MFQAGCSPRSVCNRRWDGCSVPATICKPGAHPYAVLSYDYWARRLASDPKVIGRTFRLDGSLYQIVGVGPQPFTGTETGTVTDIFVPTMMHPGVTADDWTWHRILAMVQPGVAIEPLRQKLDATSLAFERERAKGFTGMPQKFIEMFLAQKLLMEPAAAGASGLQQEYRSSLAILGVLVALVLLIACANVANLMTAQAAARAREMALRVSIGAGRFRLVQLVLVESAWLAILAAAMGVLFAWWSAPFVVSRINPPDHPARLALPADWRVLAFGLALTIGVTLLFGLAPGSACIFGKTGERAQRRRRSALAPPLDARADRRASGVLFCRALHRGAVRRHIRTGCPIAPWAFPRSGFSLSIRLPQVRNPRWSGNKWPNKSARFRVSRRSHSLCGLC